MLTKLEAPLRRTEKKRKREGERKEEEAIFSPVGGSDEG